MSRAVQTPSSANLQPLENKALLLPQICAEVSLTCCLHGLFLALNLISSASGGLILSLFGKVRPLQDINKMLGELVSASGAIAGHLPSLSYPFFLLKLRSIKKTVLRRN